VRWTAKGTSPAALRRNLKVKLVDTHSREQTIVVGVASEEPTKISSEPPQTDLSIAVD